MAVLDHGVRGRKKAFISERDDYRDKAEKEKKTYLIEFGLVPSIGICIVSRANDSLVIRPEPDNNGGFEIGSL